jgi:hypothetical protein
VTNSSPKTLCAISAPCWSDKEASERFADERVLDIFELLDLSLKFCNLSRTLGNWNGSFAVWPAPGSEDTELGVLMELEVGHGETEV